MNQLLNIKASSYLSFVIPKMMVYSGFTSGIGLMSGKIGVSILLYHYNRIAGDSEIEKYAGHLIDEVYESSAIGGLMGFDAGCLGIAWSFNYLINRGMVEGDCDEVLEDIDGLFWDESGTCSVQEYHLAGLGLYLLSRKSADIHISLWNKRIHQWIEQLKKMENPEIGTHESLIYVLYCLFLCQESDKFTTETNELFVKLHPHIETTYISASLSEKYMLREICACILKLRDISFLKEPLSGSVTLTDINKFYLFQLLCERLTITIPEEYDAKLISILQEERDMNKQLSLMNPENIGLTSNIGGLTWALIRRMIDLQGEKVKTAPILTPTTTPVLFPVSSVTTMTDKESMLLQRELWNCSNYLEFGAGNSTLLALESENIKKITTVEADLEFLDKLTRENDHMTMLQNQKGRLNILSVDIGTLSKWSRPKDESRKEFWPEYSTIPFKESDDYDLVLVDGRFRVACALNACIHLVPGTKIMIHDFYRRMAYNILLLFLEEVERADTLGLFVIKSGNDNDLIKRIIKLYEYAPNC